MFRALASSEKKGQSPPFTMNSERASEILSTVQMANLEGKKTAGEALEGDKPIDPNAINI